MIILFPVSPDNNRAMETICNTVLSLARFETGSFIFPLARNSLKPEIKISLVRIIIAAIIILTREILISGLREFLAKGKIKLPVSSLAKLKTALQMISIALLLSGDTGNKIINFQDYNAQTIGIILLWLSAALTLFTGYDYMRKGIDHAMSEDSKD